MRYIAPVFFSTFLLNIYFSGTVLAQQAKYRAGVINVTEIQAPSDGSSRHLYEIRQQLEGEDPQIISINGAKSSNVTDDDVPSAENKVMDLTEEIYANKKFTATGSSSKNSLTPSSVQDQSLGCRGVSFSVQDRIDSIFNGSASNADFTANAKFHVVDNSKRNTVCAGGTCKVLEQTYPAPNYLGPLYFEAALDQVSEIDLSPYIKDASGKFTCKLQTAKDQHGIKNTGLSENASGLSISDDCKITWDTKSAQLGEKFGLKE